VLTHLIANGRVRSVTWSPDGTTLASGSEDKTIKLWNAQTGHCLWTLSAHARYVRLDASSFADFLKNIPDAEFLENIPVLFQINCFRAC